MSEYLQTYRADKSQKILSNVLRSVTAATVLTVSTFLPFDGGNVRAQNIESVPFEPTLTSQTGDQSQKLADLLNNRDARLVLAATLGLSLAALTTSYLLGNKYDDKKARMLRMAGPAFSALTSSSLLVDSFNQIPSDVPASLIVGTSLLFAAQTIINTFESEADIKTRSSAMAAAGFMISVGLASFVALSDKI
jgi:hypothetical protein